MKILFTLLVTFSINAQAFMEFKEVSLKCRAINDGFTVAKTLDIMFLEKNHNNKKTIEYTTVNHHNSLGDTGGLVDPELGTYHGVVSKFSTENNGWNFSYEIEYFTNSINILEDDEGYKLLTKYTSDGPVGIGFYECDSNIELIKDPAYINGWSRLEKAIAINAALEIKVKISSKASCGEMDPYFIGDACAYSAKVLTDGVNDEEITIFFSDYKLDSLKIGQELNIKAITISDFDGNGSNKKSFAVQVK